MPINTLFDLIVLPDGSWGIASTLRETHVLQSWLRISGLTVVEIKSGIPSGFASCWKIVGAFGVGFAVAILIRNVAQINILPSGGNQATDPAAHTPPATIDQVIQVVGHPAGPAPARSSVYFGIICRGRSVMFRTTHPMVVAAATGTIGLLAVHLAKPAYIPALYTSLSAAAAVVTTPVTLTIGSIALGGLGCYCIYYRMRRKPKEPEALRQLGN